MQVDSDDVRWTVDLSQVSACTKALTVRIVIARGETNPLCLPPSLGHPLLRSFVRLVVQLYNDLARSMAIDVPVVGS